jgi:phosphoribosylglycinamide formyltransferase-1
MSTHRLAIFASGTGTNAENIIRYFEGSKTVQIVMVLSNNPDAGVLKRASVHNIPTFVFSRHQFYQTNEISDMLKENKITYIVLAGFLWLIPHNILNAYPDRIINIHPALLPLHGGKGMYGHKVHESVKQNREKNTGISIHLVNENYDEGKVLFRAECSIDPDKDTTDDIADKVHALEYKHFPRIIEQVLSNLNP